MEGLIRQGEFEGSSAAGIGLVFQHGLSLMEFGGFHDEGQPQPGSFVLTSWAGQRVESVKGAIDGVVRNTGATVFDRDNGMGLISFKLEGDRPAIGSEANGIFE